MARDPRGIVSSRSNLSWCQEDRACGSVDRLCEDMLSDAAHMERSIARHPDRYYLLKFEDLSARVESETEKLFKFLGLQFTIPVKTFLYTHTTGRAISNGAAAATEKRRQNEVDPFSTSRQSKDVASGWRTKLPESNISSISKTCAPVIDKLNYTP